MRMSGRTQRALSVLALAALVAIPVTAVALDGLPLAH